MFIKQYTTMQNQWKILMIKFLAWYTCFTVGLLLDPREPRIDPNIHSGKNALNYNRWSYIINKFVLKNTSKDWQEDKCFPWSKIFQG